MDETTEAVILDQPLATGGGGFNFSGFFGDLLGAGVDIAKQKQEADISKDLLKAQSKANAKAAKFEALTAFANAQAQNAAAQAAIASAARRNDGMDIKTLGLVAAGGLALLLLVR